jgi:CheY-like chemotaxis protein
MVFRVTAAGDAQIRPLTREDMPNKLDPLGDRRPRRGGVTGQRPMRVLLVDDHDITRAAVSALLRTQGAKVADLRTGEAALAVAIAFRPAVAIVDVTPADARGFVIADRLQALPDGRAAVLTSSVDRSRFAFRLDNYRFIAKADLCVQNIYPVTGQFPGEEMTTTPYDQPRHAYLASWLPFIRHYIEMVLAMAVGMFALMPLWPVALHAVGAPHLLDRAEPMALVMATDMVIGMGVVVMTVLTLRSGGFDSRVRR